MTLTLLQITAILLTCTLCGSVARRLGQAAVIGEIMGGLLLGPSILGRLAPHTAARLFPPASLASLETLSTLGLILFLFLVGAELDLSHLRTHRATTALASLFSVLVPFALALAAAPALLIRFAPLGTPALPFTLFLGVALSITALPVLARILQERGLQTTPLGTTALLCAAIDDLSAWTLIALALTLLPSPNPIPILHRLFAIAAYLIAMLAILRPLAKRLARRWTSRTRALTPIPFAAILLFLIASATVTDALGVHPLFGAFLAGLCLPHIPDWQPTLRAQLDPLVSTLLLPLFFALTGLRTRLDLLQSSRIWLWTGILILLATTGKMGGTLLAARLTHETWRNSWALATLLNTRGLVELIVLNIAYTAGLFSPALFTMLVLMALLTTAATTPLLNLLRIGTAPGTQPQPEPQTPAASISL